MRDRRLPSAAREVASKSDAQIERETAVKWAARAVACCKKYASTGSESWRLRARDYWHEALEHAALVGDGGKTVGRVEREMDRKMSEVECSVRGKRVVRRRHAARKQHTGRRS